MGITGVYAETRTQITKVKSLASAAGTQAAELSG